jgi:uncharacterized membrane protein YhfC
VGFVIKSTLQLNGAIERSTLKIGSFFIFKPIFDSSLQQNGIGEIVEAIATVLNDEEF